MKASLVLILLPLFSLSLFAGDKSSPTTEKLAASTKAWTGQKLPVYPSGQPEVSVLKIIIPTGQKLAMHKHPVINAVVVLKGNLTVTTDSGRVFQVKAGRAMIEVVDQWHYGANQGTETLEMITFYAGVKGTPIKIDKK